MQYGHQMDDTKRITVTIEREELEELRRQTGERTASGAVNRAIEEFLRIVRAREFAGLIRAGQLPPFSLTNEELESADLTEATR
jgi:hypothetical protein